VANFFLRYRRIILFIIALIVFFWLVWILRNVLLPFAIGLILAYLMLPPILWVEKRLPRKDHWMGFKRVFLILLIYLVFLAITGGILAFTIPIIVESTNEFISNLPQLIPDLIERFQNLINSLKQSIPPQFQDQVNVYLNGLLSSIGNILKNGLLTSFSFLSGSLGLILGFFSIPVFLFFLLKDAEKLTQGFYSGMSPWMAEQAKGIVGIISDVLGRYIRSSIVLGLAVGIVDFIGLIILGIPYAPLLGLWAAISELIPIIGPWLGGAAGVIVTLAVDSSKTIWVIILYAAVQILEGNVLVPRIHGQYLQVHPAVILILIVVGGHFAGLWGIILIVPVASTIVRLFRFISRTTRKEELQGPTA
jgi:predicted PurR-regulated permease PerM